MDTYILPSFAPFAVCVAIKVEEWLKVVKESDSETKTQGWWGRLPLGAAILGGVLLVSGPVASFILVKTEILGKLAIAAGTACLAFGLIFCWRFCKAGKTEAAVAAFACGFALAAALCQPVGFQLGSKKRWDDLKLLSEHLNGKDVDIAVFNTFKPAVMFYARNSVDSFFHPHQLEKVAPGTGSRRQMVIASDKVIDRLIAQPGLNLKLVERSGEWAVYEAVGARLRRNLTLEEVFTKPQAFEMAISGKGDWGPLTVPYAAGDRQWWKKK